MRASEQSDSEDTRSLWLLGVTLVLSIAAHWATMVFLPEVTARADKLRSVEMEFYERPPPSLPEVEEPPEPPKPPEKVKFRVKPPPVKLAEVVPPPPEDAPAPSDTAPPEPTAVVPIVVGISIPSIAQGGGFAVPAGNTTNGKASDKVTDASLGRAYDAPRYVPSGGADTEPVMLGEVKISYPHAARSDRGRGDLRAGLRAQ